MFFGWEPKQLEMLTCKDMVIRDHYIYTYDVGKKMKRT